MYIHYMYFSFAAFLFFWELPLEQSSCKSLLFKLVFQLFCNYFGNCRFCSMSEKPQPCESTNNYSNQFIFPQLFFILFVHNPLNAFSSDNIYLVYNYNNVCDWSCSHVFYMPVLHASFTGAADSVDFFTPDTFFIYLLPP